MTLAFKSEGHGCYAVGWNLNGRAQIAIGSVEKDNVGNWIAETLTGQRLSESRPTIHGDREFSYFASRHTAAVALVQAAGIKP